MLVQEMHIEVTQSLQKQGARITRKFLPGEIDWALNKALLVFRDSRIRRKIDNSGMYEIDQMHLDAVRVWLVTDAYLTPYLSTREDHVFAYLPSNYAYLINDSSYMLDGCVSSSYTSTEMATIYTDGVLMPVWVPTTTINSINVTVGGNTVYSVTGLTIPGKDFFSVVELIEENTELYWERCGNIYSPNSFLRQGTNPTQPIIISINSVTQTSTRRNTQVVKRFNIESTDMSMYPISNRMTNHSVVRSILGTPYYTSTIQSPISTLDSTFIKVYRDKSFTVNGVLIDYIRKPRKISLTLNQHCELPSEFHQEVCNLAVEAMMIDIADARVQLKERENLTRG